MDTTLRQYLDGERGRLANLAAALKINASAILQWSRIPAERVPSIEKATGLSRHELRPDLFGPPPSSKKRARAA
jgi:DNA-binding transcriptional regulator YdaS (Cro superfamily)